MDWARTTLKPTVEIVRKPAEQRGFAVHPRRWVVERTLARLTAHRRLARDYERHPEVSDAVIRWAGIARMLRRITRGHPTLLYPVVVCDAEPEWAGFPRSGYPVVPLRPDLVPR